MAIKFECVQAGDELWDYHAYRAGNTTIRRWGNWPVKIIDINHTEGWATVSWNGNHPERWSRRAVSALRRKPGKGGEGHG